MDEAARGLYELVERRLAEDDGLGEESGALILAALAGDDDLGELLDGARSERRTDTPPTIDPGTAGNYLSSIRVTGFRGIGPQAVLDLCPGPGLTVVTGRNGSGKSSFAEAAEIAVTGANRRWDGGRSQVWRDGWRNLHQPEIVDVTLELVGEGPPVRLQRTWTTGEGLAGGRWTRQVGPGEERAVTGAGEHTRTYRPFLSYNELGALIDAKPSEMHDSLLDLLGLEDLSRAEKRLQFARRDRESRAKALTARKKELVEELGSVSDRRAQHAVALLRLRALDLDSLAELAHGTNEQHAALADLRRVRAVELPSPEHLDAALDSLRAAQEERVRVASTHAEAGTLLAAVLRDALTWAEGVSARCPVCEQGTLDEAWQRRARDRIERADQDAAALQSAHRAVDAAEQALRSLIAPLPAVLGIDLPVDASAVVAAWMTWSRAAGRDDLGGAVREAIRGLRPALATLHEHVAQELAARDEAWRPYAASLMRLHADAAVVASEATMLHELRNAEKWLKAAAVDIRNDQMRPFSERSRDVWAQLRQESNVDLGPVRLEGTTTTRRVTLDVHVDGEEGSALGVMSQGELHAMALSLFLPRVMSDQTPFRFVIIDDPVQAMDPAKVDGLARTLSEVATRRQVVVFTHDDRLAEAVRRTEVPATVLEVSRRERSIVRVRRSNDPVQRHLSDARALVKTPELPADMKSELVASYCRSALEAAAHAAVRARRLTEGHAHADVEEALVSVHELHDVLTLAVLDDAGRSRELYPALRGAGLQGGVEVVQACKRGAHEGHPGDLDDLVRDASRLAAWLRQ